MKKITLLLLCFISLFSNAQEIPKLNAGLDLLLFQGNYENGYGTVNYSSKGGVFIEKAIQLNFLKQTFLSPGLSYKSINEKFSGGGLGGGSASNLNHHTLSGYLKIIHISEIIKVKTTALYYGVLGGTHFITWARGRASSYSLLSEQANWENPDYKEDPSHLFNKMYFGVLIGIQSTKNSFINPSFEFRLLPLYGEYKDHVLSPFELVLSLSFRGKGESKKNKN